MAIILIAWYPGILFSIDGGWAGLQIIIGVDLVLGPLLTLIVFKAGKPSLKFDLTCIATFQAVCMVAGMWIVYAERPIALVLAFDTVYSLAQQEFEDFNKDPQVLAEFPGSYPKLIYTELPEGRVQREIAAIRSQFIGDPLFIQTENYRVIPEQREAIIEIFTENENLRASVSEELQAQLPEDCLFIKFISTIQNGYICFDPEQRRISNFYENDYQRQMQE